MYLTKTRVLMFVAAIVAFAGVAYQLRHSEDVKQQQATSRNVSAPEQREKAPECPPGYTAMSERDYCFTAKGMIVPKIKDPAAAH